jgi:hypothetical protein
MSVAATLERIAAAMPEAAEDEIAVARVRLFGTRAWVAYRPDHDQRQLRRAHAVGPILGLDLLDTLMSLPAGLPVPLSALSQASRRRLRRLPEGTLTWTHSTVTRQVAPPLMPLLAMVQGTGWAKGLRAASRFAMYCARLLVVAELPPDRDVALAEASYYGVGIALRRSETLKIVVEPEAFSDWQPTPAWWWFTEEIYRSAERAAAE